MEIKRQTAMRVRISDIVNSKFVHKDGLEPSYALTDLGQKISRVKLVGTVIDKFISEDENYSSITVTDDTESIRVKAFKEDAKIFNNINLGDLVLVIGKIREYAEENYIVPEIVRKIEDPNYEILHKLDVLKGLLKHKKIFDIIKKEKEKFSDLEELKKYLIKEHGMDPDTIDGIIESFAGEEEKRIDYKPLVLETIERLDKGNGVEIEELMKECELDEEVFNEVITDLLNDGICFEPSPGVIKKV